MSSEENTKEQNMKLNRRTALQSNGKEYDKYFNKTTKMKQLVNQMKTSKFKVIGVIIILLFFACESEADKMKSYLSRPWVVNSIELDGVNYGKTLMRYNLLSLDDDLRGEIPRVLHLDKGESGDLNWKYLDSIKDGDYIKIYNTKVDYFNDTFEIVYLDKRNYLVNFVSKRVKLYCQGFGDYIGVHGI